MSNIGPISRPRSGGQFQSAEKDVQSLPKGLADAVSLAGGMLPLTVYCALFEVAASDPGSNIVEIGTAHGASAIALCLGSLSSGKTPNLITADPLEGTFSSRAKYGDVVCNKEIVEKNFIATGTDPYICSHVGKSKDLASSGKISTPIDILFLDADGRIDTDLSNLHEFLRDDAVIIVDDAVPRAKLSVRHNGAPFLDLKHRISALLLDALISREMLELDRIVGETAFCRKVKGSAWSREIIESFAIECYRDLVFTEVRSADVYQWIDRCRQIEDLPELL